MLKDFLHQGLFFKILKIILNTLKILLNTWKIFYYDTHFIKKRKKNLIFYYMLMNSISKITNELFVITPIASG